MAARPHDLSSSDPQHQSLLSAALSGDDLAFTRALLAGADVNGVYEHGLNALIAVMTGQNWDSVDASTAPVMSISRLNILNAIITHRDISLFTLNASSAVVCGVKSISPLGAAALLNKHTVVQTLLELSPGLASVDLPDGRGRTPLMYACQNGGLEVVQHLLSHGARPDFRDAQFRTAIHYGLLHPRILWHCEDFLRRHRSGEITQNVNKRNICQAAQANALYHTKSPVIPPAHFYQDSHFVHTLIETISSGKSNAVQSLLFPPSSSPQSSDPSSPDYLINAQDARGWSPIHHCVSSSSPTREILDALYLAGADISLPTAVDMHTPLHCLALTSYQPLDALDAGLLYSFTVHLVRDLRAPLGAQDRNGETCIHIAAERGASVDVLSALLDCDPKSVVREIRNSRGLTAAEVAKADYRALFGLEADRPDSAASVRTVKPKKSLKSLKSVPSLASIGSVIPTYDHIPALPLDNFIPPSASILPLVDQLFDDLRFISRVLPTTYTETDFDALEDLLADVVGMGDMLITLARDPIEAVATGLREAQSSVGRVSGLLNAVSKEIEDKLEIRTGAMMRWGESAIQARRRTTDSGSSGTTAVSQRSRATSESTKLGSNSDLSEVCGDDPSERSAVSGAEKLKKWFRKKLNVFTPPPSPTVSTQKSLTVHEEWQGTRGLALRSSDRVLDAASRDLVTIEECMTMAEQYISTGYHFLSKAETIFSQLVNSRRCAIQTGRDRARHSRMALDIQDVDLDPTLFTLPLPFPTAPTSPLGSPCPSSHSSPIFGSPELPSVDGKISDADDEQLLKSLKRLIAKKVDLKVKGAQEEIEAAHLCMRIVKDVVKGLRLTANL